MARTVLKGSLGPADMSINTSRQQKGHRGAEGGGATAPPRFPRLYHGSSKSIARTSRHEAPTSAPAITLMLNGLRPLAPEGPSQTWAFHRQEPSKSSGLQVARRKQARLFRNHLLFRCRISTSCPAALVGVEGRQQTVRDGLSLAGGRDSLALGGFLRSPTLRRRLGTP